MKRTPYLISFSIAFAFVEASVVVYLRKLFGFVAGYSVDNLPVLANFGFIRFLTPKAQIFPDPSVTNIELLRETSTIIMFLSVAWLSGNTLKERLGAFLLAFSVWDIFYYIFLRMTTGWPRGLFDTDIYFLNPFPWIGPVATPLVIFSFLSLVGLKFYLNKEESKRR